MTSIDAIRERCQQQWDSLTYEDFQAGGPKVEGAKAIRNLLAALDAAAAERDAALARVAERGDE